MGRGYTFSQELLQMMLSEERQKFVSALGEGASWRELKRIRNNIIQITSHLDSVNKNSIRSGPESRPDKTRPGDHNYR